MLKRRAVKWPPHSVYARINTQMLNASRRSVYGTCYRVYESCYENVEVTSVYDSQTSTYRHVPDMTTFGGIYIWRLAVWGPALKSKKENIIRDKDKPKAISSSALYREAVYLGAAYRDLTVPFT